MERSLLTTSEVAVALGVTAARVRQMVIGGLLPSEKVGRDVLIPANALGIAKERKTKPGPVSKVEAETKGAARNEPAETPATEPATAEAKPKAKRTKKAKA